ncbi:MAG: aldolase/citrate lyase family protein [Helicobacteraceae bacterium]|jgi:citrate lyase subunit beta/citryl-CoA lyase|nr:aldolase/citrate lyase family protein [Helicobacteraceae bacterium]
MLIRDANIIQEAIDSQNLDVLDEFVFAKKRTINRRSDFRSPLMLSAHNLKHLNKIPDLAADAIVLNLEDGVSAAMKPYALRLVMLTLSALAESDKKIIVRVNPLDEGGEDEIALLRGFMPDAIRVPKIKTPADVRRALDLCGGETELHLSIETREAWLNLAELKVNKQVTTFYLGILDLFADMGLSQELIKVDNPLLHHILGHFLLMSKAVGAKPVSFVYQEYKDDEGFQAWLELEKKIGYEAKGCISPKQAQQVQSIFGVDENERLRAEYIIRRFEEERAGGVTGFSDEKYGFIDEPIYKGALALLK